MHCCRYSRTDNDMGKIGDLFVRLGLKSDGFKKGMNEAKKETQSFGSKLGQMKAGAVAVWAAIGAAVIQFGKDFLGATNKIGDAWAAQMASMKAAYHTFIAELSNYKPDFSSFKNFFKNEWKLVKRIFKNGKEAGDAAAEMTKAFDAEFELVNSIRLQRGAIQQELNELYAMMRDTTLAPGDRKAAAERYKALLQPLADAEVKVYGDMLSKAISAWQGGKGLNRTEAEIIEFFTKVGTNAEEMAAKFPDINDVFQNFKGDKTNQPIFDVIAKYQDATNQMSQVDRELARVLNSIKATLFRSIEDVKKAVATYGQEELELDLKLDIGIDEEGLDEIESFIEQTTQQIAGNLKNKLGAEYAQIETMNSILEQSFISAYAGGMQALTDLMMGVEGANGEQVIAAFLQPLADGMKRMGMMIIEEGLAVVAFKNSIENPYAAIAAGAALVAVSSVVTSGLQKITSNPAGGTAASASSAGSSADMGKYEQEITINVVGEISGDKIILAGQKTLNKWNR